MEQLEQLRAVDHLQNGPEIHIAKGPRGNPSMEAQVDMAITRRQFDVLKWIGDFISGNGYSPSYDEIGNGLGLSSLATVHKHIQNLWDRGYLTANFNRARSIELNRRAVMLLRQRRKFDALEQAKSLSGIEDAGV